MKKCKWESSFATSFATSSAEASEVKESYGGQRKLHRAMYPKQTKVATRLIVCLIQIKRLLLSAVLSGTIGVLNIKDSSS